MAILAMKAIELIGVVARGRVKLGDVYRLERGGFCGGRCGARQTGRGGRLLMIIIMTITLMKGSRIMAVMMSALLMALTTTNMLLMMMSMVMMASLMIASMMMRVIYMEL